MMASGAANLEIELVARPDGPLRLEHFRCVERALPELPDGQVRVRGVLLSIDAANRGWMQGDVGYRAGVKPGEVMAGNGVGVVVESRTERYVAGDLVWTDLGWRRFTTAAPERLRPIAPVTPLSRRLSLYGIPGNTAYHGLFSVGRVAPGETVLISAAGGSVGLLAGQIARHHGCRVVAVAGGADKCAWLRSEYGYDAAVDHRAPDFFTALRAACADGVHVYFDNVGGVVLEAALRNMRPNGRIVCCGAASQYDLGAPAGPRGVPGLLVTKRLRMEGFLVGDYADQEPAVEAQLAAWVDAGALRALEEIHDGLESAPAALVGLLAGRNRGKVMVRLSPDPQSGPG